MMVKLDQAVLKTPKHIKNKQKSLSRAVRAGSEKLHYTVLKVEEEAA